MTSNAYYQKLFFLAQVDHNDQIIGQVERWEAHKKGILHRGFTAILTYQNQILLQHRKHPAFDSYWDLTFSSHQLYENNSLQSDKDAILIALKREWNVDESDLVTKPIYLGKIYYQAKDPRSIFIEHEYDYIYKAELKKQPAPNLDFAYGFKLINDVIAVAQMNREIAPWVGTIIKEIDLSIITS